MLVLSCGIPVSFRLQTSKCWEPRSQLLRRLRIARSLVPSLRKLTRPLPCLTAPAPLTKPLWPLIRLATLFLSVLRLPWVVLDLVLPTMTLSSRNSLSRHFLSAPKSLLIKICVVGRNLSTRWCETSATTVSLFVTWKTLTHLVSIQEIQSSLLLRKRSQIGNTLCFAVQHLKSFAIWELSESVTSSTPFIPKVKNTVSSK
mmetsp:Transcript_6664/g.12005  ORF Transcript_6664/g.12005 Transcript_6664/m.12005 type:complete len:201 (+) Transcript_6664:1594-2196(+)